MTNIKFICLDNEEELGLSEFISKEFSAQAIEASNALKELIPQFTLGVKEGFYGIGIKKAIENVPRFAYIKREDYDIEIDLLFHTFRKCIHLTNSKFDKMTIAEVIAATGAKLADISREIGIPYRTVQDWKAGKRECPAYVKLMIGKHYGLLDE